MLDVVNEADEATGKAERREVEEKGLIHRVAGAYVIMHGKVLIEKRSADKKTRPENYSIVEETLKSGEKYEEAALRGVMEETGVKATRLKEIGRKLVRDEECNDNYIIRVFKCYGEGKVKMQKEEVAEIRLLNKKELKELMDSNAKKSPALTETIGFLKEMR